MNELDFETHLAATLQKHGWHPRTLQIPSETFVDGEELAAYLNRACLGNPTLQKIGETELFRIVTNYLADAWAKGIPSAILYKKGIPLVGYNYQLQLVDPAVPENNAFTFQTQYQHDAKNLDRKLDLMLWVNGLPLAGIEIKNQQTGQTARDGMEQLLRRSRDGQCPNLFRNSLFTAALSTTKVLLSISDHPTTEKDFRPFDPSDEYYKTPENEFNTYHFYGEFLKPINLTELIHSFLYEEEKNGTKKLIFPRFHQWECVKLVRDEIEKASKKGFLGEEFLLQHSPGSGKSKTIAWLCQFLKGSFFIPGTQESIFSKVLVITDRKDLDQQLQRDLKPILGEHAVRKAESTKNLGELLQANLPPVITSTVQKFQDFDKTLWPRDKRIAIIIDEAHRSQDGVYNENMRQSLQGKAPLAEDVEFVDDIFDEVADKNTVIIALTATPTQSTLQKFGKDGKMPHHLYSMRQAIEEGYIINVAKNIVTYDTLYQLHQTGANIPLLETYPAPFLNRTLTWAAYESEDIIEEKSKIIAAIIRAKTMNAIGGKGRAMLTCISRKAAALYQKKLKELLQDYDISPLVAYTDSGDEIAKFAELNKDVGAYAKDDEELKTLFREEDRYRILVVASKFQTGFDETLLHTLFLDKPVKGINAVQTLSRLNRTHDGKEDTLIVDFTNSYEEIAKAFGQFLGQSEAIQTTVHTMDDLTVAFLSLCKETKTEPEDWTPNTKGAENPNALLDKTCQALSKKIADKKPIQNVLVILDFLMGRSILIDSIEWTTRKAVCKGVLGYLSTSTGKYSASDLREAVTAIGLATKLIHLGHKSIEITDKKKKSGGGGEPPPEVTMGEAINKLNQANLLKLQNYIQQLKSKLERFLSERTEEEKQCLKELGEACKETLYDFSEDENIQEVLLQHHESEYEKSLTDLLTMGTEDAGALLKTYLELRQAQEQLGKIETRFYTAKANLREALNETLAVAQKVDEDLEKLK